MVESFPPGRCAVAGKSNDASTAPKVANNATGQKETTSVSNDKNETRDTPNPANPPLKGEERRPPYRDQDARRRLPLLKYHMFLMRMT